MEELSRGGIAGCYHCKSIYPAAEIKETTDEGKTALCPNCGIDSVLPESSPFNLDVETLSELNKYWF